MLTDAKVRQARPRLSRYTLGDGGGVVLQVLPSVARSWRWRMAAGGRERVVTLGAYPAMSLPL
jgi:hypothetical protein